MDLDTGLSPKAPVYMQTPGQAVFKMICINCHGPNADANGRLAANLNNMTGGLAQVANFSAGLFGPVSMPGANRDEAFTLPDDASQAWQATTSEERAARYMAWMALGGTKVQLPAGILTIVQQTKVLDQRRGAFGVVASANMLSTAKGICRSLLGDDDLFKDSFTPSNPTRYHNPLIHSNGDAELWLNLCSFNNPPPIHYISSDNKLPGTFSNGGFVSAAGLLVNADRYPAQTRVGNDRGGTEPYVASGSSLPAGQSPNLWPWCVVDGDPRCPISALTDPLSSGDWMSEDQAEAWAVHGAVNAGLAVFLYIESIEGKSPPPDYDQCEELQ
jgi:hypothetical protein